MEDAFPLFRYEIEELEKERGREKNTRARISRGIENIPDRRVFAAYKSTTFQRSRCSALVVKARTCVTIDAFSPTTN